MPKISIIVPVYMAEEYLEQCVQSLLSQTCRDIEILLVDDCSEDNCPKICDDFAGMDDRVKVYHIEHAGVSAARNLGIEHASGDYLMFVDSDDWVEPDFCAVPLKTALEEDADVVVFGYRYEGKRHEVFSRPEHRGLINYNDRFLYYEDISAVCAWNKIYRKELFSDIRFPEGLYFEDAPVAYKVIHKANRLFYIDDVLYHYRIRDGSITTSNSHEKENHRYETKMIYVNDLRSWGFLDKAEEMKGSASITYILHMDSRGKHSKECDEYLHSDEFRVNGLSRKAKLLVKLYLASPSLFVLLTSLFGKRVKD